MNTTNKKYMMNRLKAVMLIEDNQVEEEKDMYPYLNYMTELVFDKNGKMTGNFDIPTDSRTMSDKDNDLDLIKEVKVIDLPISDEKPQVGQYWKDKTGNIHLLAKNDNDDEYIFQCHGIVQNYMFWTADGQHKYEDSTFNLVNQVQVIE